MTKPPDLSRLLSRTLACGAAAASLGCGASEEVILTAEEAERNPSKVVVARIGPDRLTLADVLATIAQRGPLAQERYQAPQTKFAFLEGLVDFEVLSREAERRGHHQSPRVRRALKTALADVLWRKGSLPGADRSTLTEAALIDYHRRHAAEFREPDSAVAAHILLALGEGAPLAARKAAREKAEALRAALGPTVDASRFAEEAKRHSDDDATKGKGGALTLLAGHAADADVPEELVAAAFKQALGAVTLVETPLGAHLLRVERRKAGQPAPFEAVRKQVEARVWRVTRERAWRATVEAHKLTAALQYDEAVLKGIDADVAARLAKESPVPDGGAPPPPAAPQGESPARKGAATTQPANLAKPAIPAKPANLAEPPKPSIPEKPAQPAQPGTR